MRPSWIALVLAVPAPAALAQFPITLGAGLAGQRTSQLPGGGTTLTGTTFQFVVAPFFAGYERTSLKGETRTTAASVTREYAATATDNTVLIGWPMGALTDAIEARSGLTVHLDMPMRSTKVTVRTMQGGTQVSTADFDGWTFAARPGVSLHTTLLSRGMMSVRARAFAGYTMPLAFNRPLEHDDLPGQYLAPDGGAALTTSDADAAVTSDLRGLAWSLSVYFGF